MIALAIALSAHLVAAAVQATSGTAQQAKPQTMAAPSCPTLAVKDVDSSDVLMADDAGAVATTFRLCNDTCDTAVPMSASFSDLRAGDQQNVYQLGATIALSSKPQPATSPLPKGQCVEYTASITKVWQLGQFTTTLRNGGVELGVFKVGRTRAPFKLTVDASAPLHAVAGKLRVAVVNGDSNDYHVQWGVTVGGTRCMPDPTAGDTVDLLANSVTSLHCTLPHEDTRAFLWSGTLKDDSQPGLLTLQSVARSGETTNTPRGRKELPLTVTMSYWGDTKQAFWNVFSLTILLFAGGCASLLLSAAIPRLLDRMKIRRRLRAVRQQTTKLPETVNPELGLALKVEARRIEQLAEGDLWFSPGAEENVAAAETAVDDLEKRTTYVASLAPAMGLVTTVRGGGLPPTLLQTVADSCRAAGVILRKTTLTDADKPTLDAAVNLANQVTSGSGGLNDQLATMILARETGLRSIFKIGSPADVAAAAGIPVVAAAAAAAPPGGDPAQAAAAGAALADPLTATASLTTDSAQSQASFQHLMELWPAPFDELRNAPATIDPIEYARRDTFGVKLELAVQYIRAGGADLDGLVTLLKSSRWEDFREARRRVLEAIDGVSRDDLEAALVATSASSPDVAIVCSREEPTALDALTLSICFSDTRLNRAEARTEFRPVWSFGNDSYHPHGWDVRHFFPNAKKQMCYRVSVRFEDDRGSPLERVVSRDPGAGVREVAPLTISKCIEIPAGLRPSLKMASLEVIRTALLMAMSAVALQKTAQALLSNSNFISVVVGVFATGFLIDSVKGGIDGLRSRLKGQ